MPDTVNQATTGTRDRILDAAEDLFAEKGYSGASVKIIGKRVGVTGAMINYYFQSKENLYRAVVDRIVDQLEQMAFKIIATRKPPIVRLEIYLHWFFDYVAQHPNFSRMTIMGVGGTEREHLNEIFRKRVRPLYKLGVRFFETGIENGVFLPVDVKALLLTIYAAIFTHVAERNFIQMITGYDPADPAELQRQKDALVDMVFRLLGVKRNAAD